MKGLSAEYSIYLYPVVLLNMKGLFTVYYLHHYITIFSEFNFSVFQFYSCLAG